MDGPAPKVKAGVSEAQAQVGDKDGDRGEAESVRDSRTVPMAHGMTPRVSRCDQPKSFGSKVLHGSPEGAVRHEM